MSIADLARECRAAAADVVKRHQKLGSLDLYRVLARCMELCEACQRSNSGQDELRAMIAAEPHGKNRSYVEHGSDVYTLASRFVFSGEECHANMSRYAHAMREAARLDLSSASLFDWLANNGGVNALYLRRPLAAETVSAKTIRLDRSVTMPKRGRFTLTLERGPGNVFSVVEQS